LRGLGVVVDLEFCTSPRIVFGRGALARAAELVAPLGRRVLVVRGGGHLDREGAFPALARALTGAGMQLHQATVHGEPDVPGVEALLAEARGARVDVVVGMGGGSVLDAAKAVAGLLAQEGSLLDHLEVVGRGLPLVAPVAPLVAIPTTAGTGSEVTRNAVILHRGQGFKASIRSVALVPRVALVDPALTDTVPPEVTAATGLDALCQVVEPYVSVRAQPLTDAWALTGMGLAARALARAFRDGSDHQARDDMALAALLSGACLANAGLGAAHGLAAPLGASFPVPHGVACAALLPHVMEANVAALRALPDGGGGLARYARVGQALVGPETTGDEAIERGLAFVRRLVRELSVPPLSSFGVADTHVADLVARAQRASSMKGNPVVLSPDALATCLRRALEGDPAPRRNGSSSPSAREA
jgi:alcohol dehydrogenase class IV